MIDYSRFEQDVLDLVSRAHGLSVQEGRSEVDSIAMLAVLCDGTVVPCCLDGEGRMALGSLLTQELPDILDTPRARAIREGFSRRTPSEDLCRRCGYAARFSK